MTTFKIKNTPIRLLVFISVFCLSIASFAQSQIGNTINGTNYLKSKLSGDGKRMAVASTGNVKVYDLIGNTWVQQNTIYSAVENLEISQNGKVIIVSDPEFSGETGLARVYQETGNNWTQMGTTFTGNSRDRLGNSIAISEDGLRIVLGASGVPWGTNTTRGYVQTFDWDGSTWIQVGTDLLNSNNQTIQFGSSIALSADGLYLAVTAPINDYLLTTGDIKLYQISGTTWQTLDTIQGVFNGEKHGYQLRFSNDGSTFAYSIPGNGGPVHAGSGSVSVLKRNSSNTWDSHGSWAGNWGDELGTMLDLSADGNTIAFYGSNYGLPSGYVQVHRFDGTNWNLLSEFNYGSTFYDGVNYFDLDATGSHIAIHFHSGSIGISHQTKVYGIGKVSGFVYHDVSLDCNYQIQEKGASLRYLEIMPGNIIVQTDSFGRWQCDYLPPGNYTITVDTTNTGPHQCNLQQPFTISTINEDINLPDIGIFDKGANRMANIHLSPVQINVCSARGQFVEICHDAEATNVIPSPDVYLKMDTFINLSNLSHPYTDLGNGTYILHLNQPVFPSQCKKITFDLSGSCSAAVGQSYHVEARLAKDIVFRDTIYQPYATSFVKKCSQPWDGSSLEVEGYCQNDTTYFNITNISNPGNDMNCYSPVTIFKNGHCIKADSVKLNAQQTVVYKFPANADSWHLQVAQHPLHPGKSNPRSTVENCNGLTVPSYVNTFASDDQDDYVDIVQGVIEVPSDPNDIQGLPLGKGSDGYIFGNTSIDYRIRFQNTDSNTAQTVVIRDTLDTDIDLFSFQMGSSSHDYVFRIYGNRILEWSFPNIMLSSSDHGFVSFSIDQKPDLPTGTKITNFAGIYFDQFAPVITNQTVHTVYYLTQGSDVVNACNSYTWTDGTTYTASTNAPSILLQNQLGLDSLVSLDLTIHGEAFSTAVISACDTYTWIDGTTYTTSNNSATYTYTGGSQYGCDSTVTLDLTINTVDASISVNGNMLSANATNAMYQWVDCNNGYAPIAGETNQTFISTMTGDYAVEVTQFGCTEMSPCEKIIMTNTLEVIEENVFQVFPNPTSGTINLRFGKTEPIISVKIVNIMGQTIAQETIENKNQATLEINGDAGVFIIYVEYENGRTEWSKVIKQ